MSDATATASGPLNDAAQRIRDAARYLIAALGAVGAVLISGLSLNGLPSGQHPLVAVLAAALAIAAVLAAIVLVVRIITPTELTLSDLAELERKNPEDDLIQFLGRNEELFEGHGDNLVDFRKRYVDALNERAATFDAQLTDGTNEEETSRAAAAQVASTHVQFLYPAIAGLLEVAVFYQLRRRFTSSWPLIVLAALVIAVAAGVYGWASTPPPPTPEAPLISCAGYFIKLDDLADDEPMLTQSTQGHPFPLDREAKACGFTRQDQLNAFAASLAVK